MAGDPRAMRLLAMATVSRGGLILDSGRDGEGE